tara:strand:+ start:1661 stop:2635 length:975 start_codon:yes stop_codon:yes gene_type:complete
MIKRIPIIAGEPDSINSEIIAKSWRNLNKQEKNRIFVVGNYNLLKNQLNFLKINIPLKRINSLKDCKENNLLYVLDVTLNSSEIFPKNKKKVKRYIFECFKLALKIIKNKKIRFLISCPLNKKILFNNSRIGLTEYLSKLDKKKRETIMMIFNEKFSVIPLTNHIRHKSIQKIISKNLIINKVTKISRCYKKVFKKKPNIAITGLNPHNDENRSQSEEKKIILPSIKHLKKKNINVHGPFPADTIFLKNKVKSYNLIVGMYHDQVLAPFKAVNGFDAINITLGLDFLRVSPDHGTGKDIIGKKLADASSLLKAIKFVFKYGYKT